MWWLAKLICQSHGGERLTWRRCIFNTGQEISSSDCCFLSLWTLICCCCLLLLLLFSAFRRTVNVWRQQRSQTTDKYSKACVQKATSAGQQGWWCFCICNDTYKQIAWQNAQHLVFMTGYAFVNVGSQSYCSSCTTGRSRACLYYYPPKFAARGCDGGYACVTHATNLSPQFRLREGSHLFVLRAKVHCTRLGR